MAWMRGWLGAGAALALWAGAAAATERLALTGGFLPDPARATVTAGGASATSDWVRGCPGLVAEAPALEVVVTDATRPLHLHLAAEGLAAALVETPDGLFRCVPAEGGMVSVGPLPAADGPHRLWPAPAVPGEGVAVQVLVTERELAGPELAWALLGGADLLAHDAPAAFGAVTAPTAPGASETRVALLPGALDGRVTPEGCAGRIDAARPDLAVTVAEGAPALHLRVRSEADTTLVVRAPSGELFCDDDSFGLDPALSLSAPEAGAWAVWLGVFEAAGGVEARIEVSADAPADARAGAAALDPHGGTAAARTLFGGDATEVLLGLPDARVPLAEIDGCPGRFDVGHADLALALHDPGPVLRLRVRAASDTVLAVLDPEGRLHCDDDTHGFDPELVLTDPRPGDWSVWIGVFSAEGGEAVLEVATGDAAAVSDALGVGAEPAFGRLWAPAEGVAEAALTLRGGDPADRVAPGCVGAIRPAAPDVTVTLEAAAPRLALRAASAADATLVVAVPDGRMVCDDDSVGLDPLVEILDAPAGDYAVWVGVWGAGGEAAVLQVSRDRSAVAAAGAAGGNPFVGREIGSTREALEILLEVEDLADVIAWDRVEDDGAEAMTLHGVRITDPTGELPPLEIARIAVTQLDLAGLATEAGPQRFALAVQGLAYGALMQGAGAMGAPLPALEGAPLLDAAVSFLPDGPEHRSFAASVDLEGLIGLGLRARMVWPEGWDGPADPSELILTAAELRLSDRGFVAALLADPALTGGADPAALAAELREGLREEIEAELGPVPDGGPAAQIAAALDAILAEPGRPFDLHLAMETDDPRGLEALLDDLADAMADDPRLRITVDLLRP